MSILQILKERFPLVLSGVMALIVAFSIFYYLNSINPTVPVIIVTNDLKPGHVIEAEDLTTKNFPPGLIGSDVYSYANELIGKTIYNGPVPAGSIMRSAHITSSGSLKSILKTYAPENWRAVEITAGSAIGMQGLRAGDVVHVYGVVGNEFNIISSHAIILVAPSLLESGMDTQYVVAVSPEDTLRLASKVVFGELITLVLPNQLAEYEIMNIPVLDKEIGEGDIDDISISD